MRLAGAHRAGGEVIHGADRGSAAGKSTTASTSRSWNWRRARVRAVVRGVELRGWRRGRSVGSAGVARAAGNCRAYPRGVVVRVDAEAGTGDGDAADEGQRSWPGRRGRRHPDASCAQLRRKPNFSLAAGRDLASENARVQPRRRDARMRTPARRRPHRSPRHRRVGRVRRRWQGGDSSAKRARRHSRRPRTRRTTRAAV